MHDIVYDTSGARLRPSGARLRDNNIIAPPLPSPADAATSSEDEAERERIHAAILEEGLA